MGEHAEDLINGDVDYITGEWIGNGSDQKTDDLSWRKVTGYMNTVGIKSHLHPNLLKHYGVVYSGKHPLRNA